MTEVEGTPNWKDSFRSRSLLLSPRLRIGRLVSQQTMKHPPTHSHTKNRIDTRNEQTEHAEPKSLRGNGEVPEDNAGITPTENGFTGPEKLQKNAQTQKIRLTPSNSIAALSAKQRLIEACGLIVLKIDPLPFIKGELPSERLVKMPIRIVEVGKPAAELGSLRLAECRWLFDVL